MTDISIHIDEVAGTKNFSVEINDHKQQKCFLLDDCYNSYERCLEAAMDYIKIMKINIQTNE